MNIFAQVALPGPLWQCFTYAIPKGWESRLSVGMRVRVPFRSREKIGIVNEVLLVETDASYPSNQLKTISEVLDQEPIFSPALIRLAQWASGYYQHPLGEIFFSMLPKSLKHGKKIGEIVPVSLRASLRLVEQDDILTRPYPLTEEQTSAVQAISHSNFNVCLLFGVTGSGKTEVYFNIIAEVLRRQKQALVLVPEIALTPQMVSRFKERFHIPVSVFHSNLSEKDRLLVWKNAKATQPGIMIGTRSAVFAPFRNLGIIVVDEEHDASFKQQSGFRYSARDVAVMRGRLENIPVLLGSATPSLETFYNTQHKQYQMCVLSSRVGNATFPKIRIVDVRGQELVGGMSVAAFETIRNHLNKKQKVMIFLNRRGYAPVVLCQQCGETENCTRCDAKLVWHKTIRQLICHHCERVCVMPACCSSCQKSTLITLGVGTQQLESVLRATFPDQLLMRLDRDTVRGSREMQDKIEALGSADILIGTQMLAKGHHFPELTLVVVVNADGGFYSTDFRALEHMGQLLVQVAGRSGRFKHQGEVLIQTYQPEHSLWNALLGGSYENFADILLKERQLVNLPPFAYLVLLRAEAKNPGYAQDFLKEIKHFLQKKDIGELELMGPVPSAMTRRAGRYRYQLLLHSRKRALLHCAMESLRVYIKTTIRNRLVRWTLDVDPQSFV